MLNIIISLLLIYTTSPFELNLGLLFLCAHIQRIYICIYLGNGCFVGVNTLTVPS